MYPPRKSRMWLMLVASDGASFSVGKSAFRYRIALAPRSTAVPVRVPLWFPRSRGAPRAGPPEKRRFVLEHAGPTPPSACRPAETDATVWGVTLAASAARRAKWAARLVPLAGAVLSLGCGDDVRLRLLEPSEASLDAGVDVTDVTDAADEGDGATRDASPAPPEPLHLYDFAGEGVTVVDRVGSADGEIVGGAELDGAGAVTLDGVDD